MFQKLLATALFCAAATASLAACAHPNATPHTHDGKAAHYHHNDHIHWREVAKPQCKLKAFWLSDRVGSQEYQHQHDTLDGMSFGAVEDVHIHAEDSEGAEAYPQLARVQFTNNLGDKVWIVFEGAEKIRRLLRCLGR